ncbi:lipoprotein [Streptomyces caelestis]|uniref:Lipoprotein n=3 Tax=Streptomyces TaxID=1883 RepID=A0A0M9X6R1_9ACTN|nr:lipoprotein [Streptomyces caelestis]KOV23418.1 lipoprotein [Streptomyces sp. XY152]
MARMRGVVAGFGVVCCLGLGSVGCTGSDAVPRETPAGDAVRVLREAADVLMDAGSSKATTSLEMATGGTRVTIRGEGVYDYRKRLGRLKVLLPRDPAGKAVRRPITELLAPGALFMKNRGAGVPADKWVRVDTGTLSDGNLVTGGATDPFAAAEVLRGTWSATFVGRTEVAGAKVRHYRGTADLRQASRHALDANREALDAAAKGFATARVPFDVYLDDAGRIRKLRHRFSFVNGRRDEPVAVASTTLLYDFGIPADVRLPEDGDIYAGRIAEE